MLNIVYLITRLFIEQVSIPTVLSKQIGKNSVYPRRLLTKGAKKQTAVSSPPLSFGQNIISRYELTAFVFVSIIHISYKNIPYKFTFS